MKYIQTKCIRIKRRVIADDYFKEFTFHNINYRRYIYNLFVEEYKKCEEDWNKFNPNEICKYYTKYIDKLNHDNEYYCSDIVKSVNADIRNAFKQVKNNTIENHKYNTLNFKSFDRYKGSFNVTARGYVNKTNPTSRLWITSPNTINFRASKQNHFTINFKESLYDYEDSELLYIYDKDRDVKYMFTNLDVKEISFIHELGQFFISLCIEVSYVIDVDSKPNNIAGIDLGIHNPVAIHDSNNRDIILHMSNRELNRIHYLERRAKRLQNIMDIKTKRSKNYEKVRRKFRRAWKRIYDIRRNWRKKLANKLSKYYKMICLDDFKQPGKEEHKTLPNKVKRYINHFNREHGMYYFMEDLKHACEKNGCYSVKAPKKTTRTCSCCGHENPKLPLSERELHCEECGTIIDRDINAARNCYDYLLTRTNTNIVLC